MWNWFWFRIHKRSSISPILEINWGIPANKSFWFRIYHDSSKTKKTHICKISEILLYFQRISKFSLIFSILGMSEQFFFWKFTTTFTTTFSIIPKLRPFFRKFNPLKDFLYINVHIIWKPRNVKMCEHSILLNYWTPLERNI